MGVFCMMRTIGQTGNGPRPMYSGTQGKCFVYRELIERVTHDVWVGVRVGF